MTIRAMAVMLGEVDAQAFLAGGNWDRPALAAILRAAAREHHAARSALENVERLTRPGSVAIATGQQPAVGGGPLYSLVKTAHAIAAAQELGDHAIPVFWCASEDHDLGEAGHADLLTRDASIRRFVGDLGSGRASLRFRAAARWWDGLLAHCQQHLGNGLGRAWLEEHHPLADEGMGAWTCRLFSALFTRHGLLCLEGHQLRPLWTTTMQRALTQWPRARLAELRARLLGEGAAEAFGPLTEPPVFADRPDGRVAVTETEARALLAGDPTTLSPGAALRPILQQAALPALAYVGGPGELAYHRFLMPLYEALGVAAPRLVPRCSLTLVPGWIERGAQRWQVTLDALAGAPPGGPPAPTAELLSGLDASLADLAQRPLAAIYQRRLGAGLTRLRRERERLAASLDRAHRQEQQRPSWGTLGNWLHPRGARQERTMSLFQAVWENGPGIADLLVEAARKTGPGVHGWVALR